MFGPINIELVFETDKGVKTINSTLSALAAHALTEVSPNNSSKHMDFIIDRYGSRDAEVIRVSNYFF